MNLQKNLCLFGYLFKPIRLDHKSLRARKPQVEGASNCKEPEVKHNKSGVAGQCCLGNRRSWLGDGIYSYNVGMHLTCRDSMLLQQFHISQESDRPREPSMRNNVQHRTYGLTMSCRRPKVASQCFRGLRPYHPPSSAWWLGKMWNPGGRPAWIGDPGVDWKRQDYDFEIF